MLYQERSSRPVWSLAIALSFLSSAAPTRGDDFTVEEGFTRLDNGQDLEGWAGDRTGWSITDGAIHLDSKKAKGHLFFARPHGKDCVIRLQFRATPKADSGVYVHGKQLQVRDYPTAGPKQYAGPARPAGEWNDLEFDIRDGIALVKLNGETIEKAWRIGNDAKKGFGLQKENGDFDFRRIRIQEPR